jgi:hypothetical protein
MFLSVINHRRTVASHCERLRTDANGCDRAQWLFDVHHRLQRFAAFRSGLQLFATVRPLLKT